MPLSSFRKPSPGPQAIKRLWRDEDGGTLVESVFVFPILVALLLGILQVAILEVVSVDFNNAVMASARKLRTGEADRPTTEKDFSAAICSEIALNSGCAGRLKVVVKSWQHFGDASGADLTKGNKFLPGNPKDVVLVAATYDWPLYVPLGGDAFPRGDKGDVELSSRLLFRNEPWPTE